MTTPYLPTALMMLIMKYQNPPGASEPQADGQLPTQAHWSTVNNDLVWLDECARKPVCQAFYDRLQACRRGESGPFVLRSEVVQELQAEAPVISRIMGNNLTFKECLKIQVAIDQLKSYVDGH